MNSHELEERDDAPDDDRDPSFYIAGVGASAGGLDALERFFDHVPEGCGVAFVVVTHQHPGHMSIMDELLSKHTTMPILTVTEPTPVEPDHVYLNSSDQELVLIDETLTPRPRERSTQLHLPIDIFFRSLAVDAGSRAIGVVLSGTGTDGTLGLKEIKGALGMTMVQAPEDARFDSMPLNAIVHGVVDSVATADGLPRLLIEYASLRVGLPDEATSSEASIAPLQRIFQALRRRTWHDFSQYKKNTIRRRIARRMKLHHLDALSDYAHQLETDPREVDALFKELLIGVTSFFRDPEAYEALVSKGFEALLAAKSDEDTLRVWVPACSTGEEAYSITISLLECCERLDVQPNIQVLATDLDEEAIASARKGIYPIGIAADVSEARLKRFFVCENGSYRIRRSVRDRMIFATQNVLADPPYTRIDLISCRNLLIYLEVELQQRLLSLFHYALNPNGVLFLGSAETVGACADIFEPLDAKWRLFRRRVGATQFDHASLSAFIPATASRSALRHDAEAANPNRFAKRVVAALLDHLVPPTLVLDERGDILYIHGRTGLFLEPSEGHQVQNNVYNMAREGLALSLSSAIRQVSTNPHGTAERAAHIKTNGEHVSFDIRVQRLDEPEAMRGLYLVTLRQREHEPPERSDEADPTRSSDDTLRALKIDLQAARESHQSTFEAFEATNEELKSANEELQSTNEELQSTNEELETSKEETQSLNEELQTVNAELQQKIGALSRSNDDIKNLLDSTRIATLFLDHDLCIKRYTEQARELINLIPSDLGRPLSDLATRLDYPELVADVREVLNTQELKEALVRDTEGSRYLVRMVPYRTTEGALEGLVLTLIDTSLEAQGPSKALVHLLRDAATMLSEQDHTLTYLWRVGAPPSGVPSDFIGRTDDALFDADLARELTAVKRRALQSGRPQHQTLGGEGATRFELFVVPTRNEERDVGVMSVLTRIEDA